MLPLDSSALKQVIVQLTRNQGQLEFVMTQANVNSMYADLENDRFVMFEDQRPNGDRRITSVNAENILFIVEARKM